MRLYVYLLIYQMNAKTELNCNIIYAYTEIIPMKSSNYCQNINKCIHAKNLLY